MPGWEKGKPVDPRDIPWGAQLDGSAVRLYMPQVLVQAALWQGSLLDIIGFTHFEYLRELVAVDKETRELILFPGTQDERRAKVGEHYIVRGITGFTFVVGKEKFERRYKRVAPDREVMVMDDPDFQELNRGMGMGMGDGV